METATINKAYEIYNELSFDDKEMFLDLINKQIVEERRDAIFKRAKEAEKNFSEQKCFTGNVNEIMEFLENDWNIFRWWI